MNFANDEMDYGYNFPHQNDFQEMDYGSHDGYNSNFRGRGRWPRGGPIRRGRGGFNNYEIRGPPQNHGNWNDDPQFTWGRGFGPNGPPIQRNNEDCPPIRYLMRCGVPRENLKNLPRSFLQLIDPAYCGVCNINLESFPMSRSHYSSRNHYKKQQKWLFEAPAEMGFRQSKNETPMKSRDLYCELCDVQITSKAHADSHYSGKAHRASDSDVSRVYDYVKSPLPATKVVKPKTKSIKRKASTVVESESSNKKTGHIDLFGFEESTGLPSTTKSDLSSTLLSRVANGKVRRTADLKGAFFVELKVYHKEDIISTDPAERWKKAAVALKLQLDTGTSQWNSLQKFMHNAHELFEDSEPVYYSDKIHFK